MQPLSYDVGALWRGEGLAATQRGAAHRRRPERPRPGANGGGAAGWAGL